MLSQMKSREARLRRLAERRETRLLKSRCRTPSHPEFGGYMLVTAHSNIVVDGSHPHAFSLNLDEVESLLAAVSLSGGE